MRQQPIDQIAWEQVESSNVEATYWDEPTQTICVRFKNGGLYTYLGANSAYYFNLRYADSVGKYLNNVIKAFPVTRWTSEQELISHLNVG